MHKKYTHESRKKLVIVLLSSSGSALLPILLKEFYSHGISVAANVLDGTLNERNRNIQEDRTKGFFEWPDFSDVQKYNIPQYDVDNHNSEKSTEILKRLKPDVIINAGTPRILKKPILEIPSRGIVNTHPGLLPAYRGCTVVEWALYNDDPVGATCHFMTEGIDEGPLIYSEVMPIARGDVYEAVRTNMIYHWARVTRKGIERIRDEHISSVTLPPQGQGTYYAVIPDDKLEVVKEKLIAGLYKCYKKRHDARSL